MIRNEDGTMYTARLMLCAIFEAESRDLFDVRQTILGHVQQGGDPSPFDRIQATRLASACIDFLIKQADAQTIDCTFIGWQKGKLVQNNLEDFTRMVDWQHQRPKDQWWLELRPIARLLAQPGPTKSKKPRVKSDMGTKTVATNRKARHEYFILETYEAGIALQGSEIKSIRAGQISLGEAYIRIDGHEAWLEDAHIAPYEQANRFNHDSTTSAEATFAPKRNPPSLE